MRRKLRREEGKPGTDSRSKDRYMAEALIRDRTTGNEYGATDASVVRGKLAGIEERPDDVDQRSRRSAAEASSPRRNSSSPESGPPRQGRQEHFVEDLVEGTVRAEKPREASLPDLFEDPLVAEKVHRPPDRRPAFPVALAQRPAVASSQKRQERLAPQIPQPVRRPPRARAPRRHVGAEVLRGFESGVQPRRGASRPAAIGPAPARARDRRDATERPLARSAGRHWTRGSAARAAAISKPERTNSAASRSRSSGCVAGFEADRSSTGSTRPVPKYLAQTRFTKLRAKSGLSGRTSHRQRSSADLGTPPGAAPGSPR